MHNLHRTLAAVRKRSRAVVDQQQQQQQQQQGTEDALPCGPGEKEGMTTAEMRRAVNERCGGTTCVNVHSNQP